jgi:hypothetical protein
MPLYYFHVFNDDITIDEEGRECADMDEARTHAIEGARELACESIKQGHLNLDHRIEIVNDAGAREMTVTFREAFTVRG